MEKNYIVTKSNTLITSNYDLSVQEQKIILTLASMVQPQDENFKPYIFKIHDFMELLGIESKTKYTEIPKITKELMQKVFEIKRGNKVIQLSWLSSVEYEKGTGLVELEFSPKLKPYLLELKGLHTSYKLENILSLKSKYSIRLYEILKSNLFKNDIEIELEDLKRMVGATEKAYKTYTNFKSKVIFQAQNELPLKTDICFEFKEIKTGRKVTSLKFYINTNKTKNKAIEEACVTLEGKYTNEEEKHFIELINEVKSIFKENIEGFEAKSILDTAKGNINIIKEKYEIAKVTPGIKGIVGWMCDAIKRDYQQLKGKVDNGSFNNYEQRSYDFDKLEKALLGWDKTKEDEVGEKYQQSTIEKF